MNNQIAVNVTFYAIMVIVIDVGGRWRMSVFKNNAITARLIFIFSLIAAVLLAPITYAVEPTITITYPYYGFVEDPENPWGTVFDALDETGTVEFSDEFFFEPSPGNHPTLRTLSYALALAGYENQADGYPITSSIPNPKLTQR